MSAAVKKGGSPHVPLTARQLGYISDVTGRKWYDRLWAHRVSSLRLTSSGAIGGTADILRADFEAAWPTLWSPLIMRSADISRTCRHAGPSRRPNASRGATGIIFK